MNNLPARLFLCPECAYKSKYRWVLTNHLEARHKMEKNDAKRISADAEYVAKPRYYRRFQ